MSLKLQKTVFVLPGQVGCKPLVCDRTLNRNKEAGQRSRGGAQSSSTSKAASEVFDRVVVRRKKPNKASSSSVGEEKGQGVSEVSSIRFSEQQGLFGLESVKGKKIVPLVITTLLATTDALKDGLHPSVRTGNVYADLFREEFRKNILRPFFTKTPKFVKRHLQGPFAYIHNFEPLMRSGMPLTNLTAFKSLFEKLGIPGKEIELTQFCKIEDSLTAAGEKALYYANGVTLIPIVNFDPKDKCYLNTTEAYMDHLCQQRGVYSEYLCLSRSDNGQQAVLPSTNIEVRGQDYQLVSIVTNSRKGALSYFVEGDRIYEYGFYNSKEEKLEALCLADEIVSGFHIGVDNLIESLNCDNPSLVQEVLFDAISSKDKIARLLIKNIFSTFFNIATSSAKGGELDRLNNARDMFFEAFNRKYKRITPSTLSVMEKVRDVLSRYLGLEDEVLQRTAEESLGFLKEFFTSLLREYNGLSDAGEDVGLQHVKGVFQGFLEKGGENKENDRSSCLLFVKEIILIGFEAIKEVAETRIDRRLKQSDNLYYQVQDACEEFTDSSVNPLNYEMKDYKGLNLSSGLQLRLAGEFQEVKEVARSAKLYIYKKVDEP